MPLAGIAFVGPRELMFVFTRRERFAASYLLRQPTADRAAGPNKDRPVPASAEGGFSRIASSTQAAQRKL